MELTMRISQELRLKVTELQSFSPDELGNIPKRSNQKYETLFTETKNTLL